MLFEFDYVIVFYVWNDFIVVMVYVGVGDD